MSSLDLKYPTVVAEAQNPTVVVEDPQEDGRFQAQTCIIPDKVSTTYASPGIGSTVPGDFSGIVLEEKQGSDSPDKKDAVRSHPLKSKVDTVKFDTLYREVNVYKTVTILVENCLKEKPINGFNVYVTSGKLFSVLPDEISAGESDSFLFFKTPWSVFRGAVGIMTFAIEDNADRLVAYFCNPFVGHNEFGLDWIHADHDEDPASFELAKSFWHRKRLKKTLWVVRDRMKKEEIMSPSGYRARGFMTQGHHAKMTVKILDSE